MGILDHPSSSGSQPGQPRGMTSSSTSGPLGIEWRKWFPPVTSRSFLSHYLPASGAISHTLYTVHLFSPNIISSLFPTGDLAVSNTILFNANVGLGFYVYFRRHLHRVNPWERVEFSVLSSTLFNFGSLLAAVLIKALFPSKTPTWLKSLTATVLSGYLLSRAAKYMGLLDHRASSGRGSVSPARSVLSRRQTALPSGNQPSPVDDTVPTSSELHLDTQSSSPPMPSSMETPPQSQEFYSSAFMTPSATEHTGSEMGGSLEESGMPSDRQNYRYLHSYALNMLSQTPHRKETILRRTVKQQKPLEMSKTPLPISFVTPDPSPSKTTLYTPPPSRLEVPKRSAHRKTRKPVNERDRLDEYIDVAIGHAPLALGTFALGCWYTGTVPMWTTIKFIFSA